MSGSVVALTMSRRASHRQDDLLQVWAYHQSAAGHTESTVAQRVKFIQGLASAAGKRAADLSAADLVESLSRDLAPWSKRTYFLHARAWFRWLVAEGHRTDEPTARMPVPRAPRVLPRPMTDDILVRAIETARPVVAAYLTLAAYGGLRAFEIAQIRGEDLDDRMITVRGKGGVLAMVPTHPQVELLRRAYPAAGYWFPGRRGHAHVLPKSVSTTVTLHLRQQGIPSTLHRARHWYGTNVLRASGGNLRVAQLCLRHASPATTAGYTLINDDERVAAVAALPDLLGRAA